MKTIKHIKTYIVCVPFYLKICIIDAYNQETRKMKHIKILCAFFYDYRWVSFVTILLKAMNFSIANPERMKSAQVYALVKVV